jgi:hypothetical protein
MTLASIATRARAAAPLLLAWARQRAAERSTWIGLAAIATAAGKSVLADHLTSAAEIVPMLIGVVGAAIAAASTTHTPPNA